MKEYDAIVIGTGQASSTMIPALVELGQSVAVVENDRVGGTCVNYGCTPTKTIVASARVAHMVRRARDFGINVPEFTVDFPKVMERQNAIRDGGSKGLGEWLKGMTDFYDGTGQFVGPHEVQIGDDVIRGKSIYIHTGARARKPTIPGIDGVQYLTNRTLLDLAELPEHLIVVGGSYIGLEFSQAFRRFGAKVTVIEMGENIMPREDPDVSVTAREILEDEGITILCGSTITGVSQSGTTVNVDLERNGESQTVSGTHILFAIGRVANSDELNLDAAGVKTDDRGFITVNDQLQTNVPHIYAVGDINGRGAFTHTSVHDGQVIVKNLKGEDWKQSDRKLVYSMFMDPPLARVGMNETMARASGRNVLMATYPMSRINRAREKDETRGTVKFLVDAETKEILGATILGIGGDEIINGIATWMYTGLPYTDMQRAVLVHPTVAELMPWILDELQPLEQVEA